MTDRTLYHTPGSCSRVALIALEAIGAPYEEVCVALHSGAQHAPAFLAMNPKGKVPVLVDDGAAITELPVILHHLAHAHPEAGLLPAVHGTHGLVPLADLVWIAGALHTSVARVFRPDAYSAADPAGVKAIATAQLAGHAAMISARLADRDWWYGAQWSIADSFLCWVFALAVQYDFPLVDFPLLAAHRARSEAQPAFVRARAREREIAERTGLPMPPGMTL